MAAYKHNKKIVRQAETPPEKAVRSEGNPLIFITEHPAWNFAACDTSLWPFSALAAGNIFWTEILPFLQSLKTMTWQEILNYSNNKHHLINSNSLNKSARDRLYELHIEAEAVLSLRVTATLRLYGFLDGAVFHMIWVDTHHGDNDTCVCRSRKKHT